MLRIYSLSLSVFNRQPVMIENVRTSWCCFWASTTLISSKFSVNIVAWVSHCESVYFIYFVSVMILLIFFFLPYSPVLYHAGKCSEWSRKGTYHWEDGVWSRTVKDSLSASRDRKRRYYSCKTLYFKLLVKCEKCCLLLVVLCVCRRRDLAGREWGNPGLMTWKRWMLIMER